MKNLLTILFVFIGLTVFSQSRPKQMKGDYQFTGTVIFSDTILQDTSTNFPIVLVGNSNSGLGFDTTGYAETGRFKLIPKVFSGGGGATYFGGDSIDIDGSNFINFTGLNAADLGNLTDSLDAVRALIITYVAGAGINLAGDTIELRNAASFPENEVLFYSQTFDRFEGSNLTYTSEEFTIPFESAAAKYAFNASSAGMTPNTIALEEVSTGSDLITIYADTVKSNLAIILPDTSATAVGQVLKVKAINSVLGFDAVSTEWGTASGGNDSDWVQNGTSLYNRAGNEVVINNDTTLEGAKLEVWGGSGGTGVNYSVNLIENQSQILEQTLVGGVGHIDTTYKQLWDFGVGDTLYNYRWANAGSPRGVDMPATSSSGLQARVTFKDIEREVGAYMFQANYPITFSDVLPSSFKLIASNDTSVSWDTLSSVSGLNSTQYGSDPANFDSIQVFTIANPNTYNFYRFIVDSAVSIPSNTVSAVGFAEIDNVALSNFKLFPTGRIPVFEVFEDGLAETEKLEIKTSARNGVVFDTLAIAGNDTVITLDFSASQSIHAYSNDASLTGILIDLDTSKLTAGFIQDFSLSLEIDTGVTAPTLYFQAGKFQLVQGTAPTLTTDNTDQTRKDVFTFRYDGAALRAKVLEVKDFRNN